VNIGVRPEAGSPAGTCPDADEEAVGEDMVSPHRLAGKGARRLPSDDGEPCGGGPLAVLHVRAGGRRGHSDASSQISVRRM
jgi:hypothetical protein